MFKKLLVFILPILILFPTTSAYAYSVNLKFNNNGADSGVKNDITFPTTKITGSGNNMVKEGYTQVGWGISASKQDEMWNCSSEHIDLSKYANKTITLYAQWEPNSYRVRYNANGGTGTMTDDFVKYNQDYTLKTNQFAKAGYKFAGWKINNNTMTKIAKNTINTYFKANNPKRFRIDWSNTNLPAEGANNGSFRYDFQKIGMTIDTATNVTWNYNCQGCTIITENNKDYLVAYFCPSTGTKNPPDEDVMTKFELDTGKLVYYKRNIHVGHGNGLTYNPTNKHYYVHGFTDFCDVKNAVYVENGTKVTNRTVELDENFNFVKLIKHEGENNYFNIAYYDNKFYMIRSDGIQVFNSDFSKRIQIKRFDKTYPKFDVTVTNLAFQSSVCSEDYIYAPGWSSTPHRNVVCVYDRKTLNFIGYVGYKSPFYQGETTLNSTFSKEIEGLGIDKSGNLWAMSINRGSIEAAKVSSDGFPTKTAVAQWEPVTYNITYNLDGGTNNTSNPSTYTVETTTISLKNPTKTGYTFAGWKEGNTIAKGSTGNKTFTAQWTPKTVKVIFHYNTPELDKTYTETYTYNKTNQTFGMNLTDKSGSFGKWTRTNYTLLGWNINKNASVKQYNIYSGVTDTWINTNAGTINVYAIWKPIIDNGWYTISPKVSSLYRIGVADTKNGTLAKLYTANNKVGQKFYFKQQSDGTYKIGTGTTIGFSALGASEIQQKYNSSDKKQKWNILLNADGSYTLTNVSTGKAISYSSLKNDSGLSEVVKADNNNQKFSIKPFDEAYTVTFVDGVGKTLKRQSVKRGKGATAPSNPTRTGYTFAGWDNQFNNITGNLTVTAKWTAK